MSSETPGGGVTTPIAGSSGDNHQISKMSRVHTISDEITIYEITAPVLAKPTLKPLSFEVPQEFFKGSPTKMSPQKLSPLSGGSQSPKVLGVSPSSFSILSPKREGQSPCDQLPQFVHSPSSHHVLLIPSKPELTVTVVNSVNHSEVPMPIDIPKSPSPTPFQLRINPVEEMTVESEKDEDKSSNAAENEDEEVSAARRKRRRRVFTPHPNSTMYRTRTVTKASLAAQNEKDELASQKVKNEVPSVKPIIKEAEATLSLVLSSRGTRKRSQRKLSTAEQLQELRENRSIDLENSGSILRLINLKNVLTRQNFLSLPLEDQMTLLRALPDVDTVSDPGKADQPCEDAFDNLFYNKACEDWKAKLIAGDFTPEMKLKQKQEAEREKARVDPWKRKHFEPIWGYTDVRKSLVLNPPEPTRPSPPSCTVTREDPPSTSLDVEQEPPLLNKEVVIGELEEVKEMNTVTTPEEIEPTPPKSTSSDSPPSPTKRVASANIDQEFPILSKRIRIIPPIQSPITQVSLPDELLPKKSEKLGPNEEVTRGMEEVKEVAKSELENELASENEVPVPEDVDNEVTILSSPCPSSPSPSFEAMSVELPATQEELMTSTPEECEEEEVVIIQTSSSSVEEVAENVLPEEIQSDKKPYEEIAAEEVQDQVVVERISGVEIVDTLHRDEEEVLIEETKEVLQGEQSIPVEEPAEPPSQILSTEGEAGSVEQELVIGIESRTVEVMSERVMNQVPEKILMTPTEPLINPTVTNQQPLNNPPPPPPSISSPSLRPIPLSPITTTSIRLPMSHPSGLTTERLPQPLILRMVSINPPPNGPLHQQTPSVRLGPPQQPTSLQPIVLKPIGMGGVKSEPIIRNQFIPVQPRTFLASLPEAGKPPPPPPHGQSMSPLIKLNGPGTIGNIPSPSSPGNVSSLLSSKKINRQKPRQAKPKLSTVPPGSVNLDRSYQICNAVIQNSPNREQLQKQLVKPPPLTQNNRIMRPELGSTGDVPTTVIQMGRRASTPTLLQSSGGQMQLQQSGPQKVVLVNHHQGMAPLIRPIQQQQQQTQQGLNHQIVVSTSSSSNGIGQRGLGMNVTFTTKHNPTTNNQSTPTTLTSTPNVITPQQLALLLQQQHPINQISRPQHQQTQILTHQLRPQQQQQQQQRTSLFISRPPPQSQQQQQQQQQQQTQQVKILNSTQFPNHTRLGSSQILQFQQRSSLQIPQQQEIIQYPIRAQIMHPNGETLTIHRAGGIQPMRVNSTMRPTIHHAMQNSEQGKRGPSPSGTPPLTTIINRTNLPDSVIQSLVNANSQTHDSSSPSTVLNPAQNLADFITSQLTASNIRPISPLAYEQGPGDKIQQQRVIATSKSRESALNPNSPSTVLNPSHQMSQSDIFISNHQKSIPNSQQQQQQQQIGLQDLMTEATILDLQDALGDGSPFSILREHTNGGGGPTEFIQIERGGVDESLAPPPLQPNTPNGGPTNHNYSLAHKRLQAIEGGGGGGLVQNTRLDGPGGEGLQQQHYVIVQTTGSNGMPQNLVLQASLLMQQGQQQVKEEGKLGGNGGPPRASSAPPTNPTTVIIPQQSSHGDIQENKHMSLPVNFQDFSGIRLVYKDESGDNEDLRRMEYCVTSAPSSYTLTPVSSAGGQPGIVRMMNRSTAASPDVWNYNPVTPSGHIVNVNLNGSTGSARIIPGQHPVISIPDTTNGSSSCSGMSSDFDLFSAIATTGNEGIKIENNGDSRSILIPVSMTNNNRQHFQPHPTNQQGQEVSLSSNPGNCVCDLRAMTACRKCGAYSHNDCKNGMELCMGCIIR